MTVVGVQGRIDLPFGQFRIKVCDEHMYFRVNVGNEDDLDLAEQVVSNHLLRMANKEEPDVQWMRQK